MKINSLFNIKNEKLNKKLDDDRIKIGSDSEMLIFLKQFITLTETDCTPYKHKKSSYNKKAHYINGKKVNEQVYNYIKKWLMNQNDEGEIR